MKCSLSVVLTVAAFVVALSGQAIAGQSGFASLHAQHISKGRLCFTAHTHVGTGGSYPSKRSAVASAAKSWSSFTAFEYGTDWASWRAANAKKIMCNPNRGTWICEVHARPCLKGRRGSRQARR